MAEDSQARQSEHSTVYSVEKALSIVDCLMRTDTSMTAREIALKIGINRTTAHRLLNTLMHRGWIDRLADGAGYRISLQHLVLSNLAYDRSDVLGAIRPHLFAISAFSRETVHVGVLDQHELVHVDKIDSPERVGVSSTIGTRALPHLTALGKAILAMSAQDVIDSYIGFATRLPDTAARVDATWLSEELARTRDAGFSIDDEEDSLGVRCIGSAIVASSGEPIFAVSITGPSGRFTLERAQSCAPVLMRATYELSCTVFGWSESLHSQGLSATR